MKHIWWLVSWAVILLMLGGCGTSGSSEAGGSTETVSQESAPPKPRELSVTLDGWHGARNVGILMAYSRGYFADAGLEVHTYTPATPARPIPYVTGREVDLSVAQLPQVVLARERGAPIVCLGTVIDQPTAAMIWLKDSDLHSVADLEGETIGIPGVPFQKAFLEYVLEEAGLKPGAVTIKTVGYDLVPDLTKGKVDAIFGGSGNIEGVKLEARGLEPVTTEVKDLGVPAYDELVVVARRDDVAKRHEAYRRFMDAVAKGTAAALENPEEAAEVVANETAEGEPFLGPGVAQAQVEATIPLLSRDGLTDPERAGQLVEWMNEQGMIEKTLPPQAFLAGDSR